MATRLPVIWLTGLSGAGKSTIAEGLRSELGSPVWILDGDVLRRGLCADLTYSSADRAENVRRAACVAALFADAGMTVVVALISPFRGDRARAREIVGADRFIEVFVDASLEACERRDTKGLYARARRGEIADFTGISSPYEPPESPDLIVSTADLDAPAAVQTICEFLRQRGAD